MHTANIHHVNQLALMIVLNICLLNVRDMISFVMCCCQSGNHILMVEHSSQLLVFAYICCLVSHQAHMIANGRTNSPSGMNRWVISLLVWTITCLLVNNTLSHYNPTSISLCCDPCDKLLCYAQWRHLWSVVCCITLNDVICDTLSRNQFLFSPIITVPNSLVIRCFDALITINMMLMYHLSLCKTDYSHSHHLLDTLPYKNIDLPPPLSQYWTRRSRSVYLVKHQ